MKLYLSKFTAGILVLSMVSCTSNKKEKVETVNSEPQQEGYSMLVGTYTSGSSEGIYKVSFNPNTSELSQATLVAASENPSFLTQSKDGRFVYAVNENDPGTLSAFKWNAASSKLELQSKNSDDGKHPCFIEMSPSQNQVAIANYSSGDVSVYKIKNGVVQEPAQTKYHEGSSVLKPNQDAPHAHSSKFSKDGNFLFVADLGIDEIMGYKISEDGKISDQFTALEMDVGDGPRHFIFHPLKDIVYIISEFSNTITIANLDVNSGIMTKMGKVSTLPSDFKGDSYCADIQISSDGKYVYGSNRGHNSIAVFSVDENGGLKMVQAESVQGDWPRNFALTPDDNHLLVANQKSDNITVFKRDANSGLLIYTGNELKMSMPVCLKFY